MTSSVTEYHNRQVIPRFFPVELAIYLGDLHPVKESKKAVLLNKGAHKVKETQWEFYKELYYAIDFVGSALAIRDYDNPSVRSAAEFIIRNKGSKKYAKILAEKILFPNNKDIPEFNFLMDKDIIYGKISNIKELLSVYQINPYKWCELAFYYALLGQDSQACDAMNIALAIGINNRYVLRSAARLFLHVGSSDQALYFLRKSNLSKIDPWIISSEIAISNLSEVTPHTTKAGMLLVLDENIDPHNLSELRSSIGTLEVHSGAIKKGKKLIESSLNKPTENSIAQAEWLYRNIIGGVMSNAIRGVPAVFEADTRAFFGQKEYEKALSSSEGWLSFQPFSATPAEAGSYIATIALNDNKKAIEICKKGSLASPDNFLLKNNMAFAYGREGDTVNARLILDGVNVDELDEKNFNVFNATQGLIEFRDGNLSRGRELYLSAVEGLAKSKNIRSLAIAFYCWAKEEENAEDHDASRLLLDKAKEFAKREEMHELLKHMK